MIGVGVGTGVLDCDGEGLFEGFGLADCEGDAEREGSGDLEADAEGLADGFGVAVVVGVGDFGDDEALGCAVPTFTTSELL